jgi:hypothetical protein
MFHMKQDVPVERFKLRAVATIADMLLERAANVVGHKIASVSVTARRVTLLMNASGVRLAQQNSAPYAH